METEILEKLCNEIVDVVYETFTRTYYFVKISQSKKGHIYIIARKNRCRFIGGEKTPFIKKYLVFLQVFSNGTVINMTPWAKNISLIRN